MAQREPDIRVLVGVEGDVGIDSGSGKLISKTLKSIAKNISGRETPHITFGVDFQQTSKKIYKQLSDITKAIKLEPIDLTIQTNQSSMGTFAEDEYRKVIDATSGKKAKVNIIAHAQEKQGLADVAVQMQKNIELTNKQTQAEKERTDQLRELIENIKFANSPEASTKHNAIENSFDKLGANDNAVDEYKKLQDLKAFVFKRIAEMHSKYGTTDSQSLAEKLVDSKDIKDLTDFNGVLTQYKTSLEQIDKLSRVDSPTFVKDVRNATNDKNLEEFVLTLTRFEQMNDKFKSNSGLAAQFESIKASAAGFKATGNFSDVDVKNLRTQLSKLNIEMTNLGLNGQSAFGKLRAQMEKLGVYFSASAIMMGTLRQIKQMTTNVIELDTAMTELKKVTNETDATYSKFLDNAERRAKSIGASLTDTITATADFARLGYSLSEAEQISDAALVYRNVGDGIRDVNAASESVISTIKAFGVEASNAMSIVDRFNEVGNNFAISSKGVGDALQRSASALAVAGNSIDESIALIVGANAVVQDPDVVGTALKTAALRLTSSRGELEALGEDAEGAAESITKLQTQLLNLTKGKVDIMLDEDTFKSTYKILLEMSKVFDSMSQKDQMDALELMFGKRGANVGSSIIMNMADAEKALETSINSAGSAVAENEKVLDSIKGKTVQFQAQFEALSNTIIDSELIKFAYDSGTGLLGFLDGVIKNLGTIPTLATVAAGALSAINNKGGLAKIQWQHITCVESQRTYALYNLVETLNELIIISKRLYNKSLKWCA